MSATLHNIKSNYWVNFPSEVPIKATQSFVATAVIGLVCGSALNVALVGGALAATATLIEAITRPIMQAILPKHEPVGIGIQVGLSILMAVSFANWMGVSYKLTPLITILGMHMINSEPYGRKVGVITIL